MNTHEIKSEKSADTPLTPYNVSVTKISSGIYAIGSNPAEPDMADDRDSDLKRPRVETLLARGVLSSRIKGWGNELIVKKLNPWEFFGIVDVKIRKYDGQLIHYSGKGLEFKGSPQLAFWNFIEPFLKKGIDEWLEHIADLCLQRGKEPKPYLQTVRNSLKVCIHDVYLRMSDIDYKLRKGAAACRAVENFGKNIRREDVRDKISCMINLLNDRYKEVLDTAQADLASTQKKKSEKPAETKQKGTESPIHIQNFHGIMGDVRAENVQTGDYASIHKHTEIETKGNLKRLLKIIGAVVGFLAALLTCLYYLGWLEPIKELFKK